MPAPALLSPATAEQLKRLIGHTPAKAPPPPRRRRAAPPPGFVRVTGAAVSGWYPAVATAPKADGTWTDFGACQVSELNGGALVSGTRYPAHRTGDHTDGTPRYVVTDVPSESFSGARVYRSSYQTVNHNTLTVLSFDTERFDTDNYFSSPNTTRLTAPATGYYLVGASVRLSGNVLMAELNIRENAGGTLANVASVTDNSEAAAETGSDVKLSAATLVTSSSGTYYEVTLLQKDDAAGNNFAQASNSSTLKDQCEFWMYRVG